MITEIISGVVTSGVIVGVVESVATWRRKRAEGKASDYEAQAKGLDLVSEFYEKVKALDGERGEKLDSIQADIKDLKRDVKDITEFLNGDYRTFKKKKYNITDLDR